MTNQLLYVLYQQTVRALPKVIRHRRKKWIKLHTLLRIVRIWTQGGPHFMLLELEGSVSLTENSDESTTPPAPDVENFSEGKSQRAAEACPTCRRRRRARSPRWPDAASSNMIVRPSWRSAGLPEFPRSAERMRTTAAVDDTSSSRRRNCALEQIHADGSTSCALLSERTALSPGSTEFRPQDRQLSSAGCIRSLPGALRHVSTT